MWQFMRQHPLCAVVTQSQQGMVASHIPMVLEEDGEFGVLRGHVARANSQWNNLKTDEALVIFSGPSWMEDSFSNELNSTSGLEPLSSVTAIFVQPLETV